jgi:hypothetical protein
MQGTCCERSDRYEEALSPFLCYKARYWMVRDGLVDWEASHALDFAWERLPKPFDVGGFGFFAGYSRVPCTHGGDCRPSTLIRCPWHSHRPWYMPRCRAGNGVGDCDGCGGNQQTSWRCVAAKKHSVNLTNRRGYQAAFACYRHRRLPRGACPPGNDGRAGE